MITQALFAVCICLLVLITVTDFRTGFIPDTLSIPFVLFACIRALLIGPFPWILLLIAVIFFGGQWLLSRGKWIGGVDVVVATGIALLLIRTDLFIIALFVTYIIGGVVAGFMMSTGQKKREIPFAPLLAAGALTSFFAGNLILRFIGN